IAHEECSIIDSNWELVDNSTSTIFCPLNLRKTVIELIEDHSSQHMLLPKSD
ncbi:7446_t:CDS:1, partial [Racocetra persica]